MKNCLTCKLRIANDCDFGEAVDGIRDYIDTDVGFDTVINSLEENIKQYINCDYYESE